MIVHRVSQAEAEALALTVRREDFIFRTDSDLGQLAAIRVGVGIGVCHVRLGDRDDNLVQLVPQAFDMGFDTWVVTHEDLKHVHRVRLAFDALVEGLAVYAG